MLTRFLKATNTAYRDINAVQMFGISRPEAFDWETERDAIIAQRLEEADPDLNGDDISDSLTEEEPTPTLESISQISYSPPTSPSQVVARERSEREAKKAQKSSRKPSSPPMSPSQAVSRERSVREAREERKSSLQEHTNPLCESESNKCPHMADDDVSEEERQLLNKLESLRGSTKKKKTRKKPDHTAKDDPTQILEQIRSIDDGAVMSMTSDKPFLAVTEIMKNVK